MLSNYAILKDKAEKNDRVRNKLIPLLFKLSAENMAVYVR